MNEMKNSADLTLPSGVNVEIPREFARYCEGHPVKVGTSAETKSDLHIAWDDNAVSFSTSGVKIEFAREALLGMVVNPSEEISGMEACTLRIGIVEKNGNKALLPILSANPQDKNDFLSLVDAMSSLSMPLKTFTSPKDLLTMT